MSRTQSLRLRHDRFGRSNLDMYIQNYLNRQLGGILNTEANLTRLIDALEKKYLLFNLSATELNFNGRRIVNISPVTPDSNDPATKGYVWANTLYYRSKLDSYDAKSKKIVNLAPPTEPSDAINLQFLKQELAKLRSELAKKP